MRMKKLVVIAGLTLSAVLVTAAVALVPTARPTAPASPTWAIPSATTPSRISLGNFEYQPTIGGVTVNIHCNDYTRYHETTADHGAHPKTIFNSTYCYDGDTRYFVHVEAIDRGEGANEDAPVTLCASPLRCSRRD